MKYDYTAPIVQSARKVFRESLVLARHYYSEGNRRLFTLWLSNARFARASVIAHAIKL